MSLNRDIHSMFIDIESVRMRFYEGSDMSFGMRIAGSRAERKYHFGRIEEFRQRIKDVQTQSRWTNRRQRLTKIGNEWLDYKSTELRFFFNERIFKVVPKDSELYRELMEPESNGPYMASTSSLISDIPNLDTEQQSIFSLSTDGLETPKQEPTYLPDIEEELPDIEGQLNLEDRLPEFLKRAGEIYSNDAKEALDCATSHLYNLSEDQGHQIVALHEKLEGVVSGFGDLYMGSYILREGDGPYEFIRMVVAKKNKMPSDDSLNHADEREQRLTLRRRMLKEAKIASSLDHPNITHYFGLFVKASDLKNDLDDFYLVSDYVHWGLARAYFAEPKNRRPEVAEKLFCDLMDGLTYMHSEYVDGNYEKKMVYHGDLKGSNYLVELEPDKADSSKVIVTGKITDFGLSCLVRSDTAEGDSQVSGAVRWRAPELSDKDGIDPGEREPLMEKADVWSFAMTCLEVVENKIPFSSIKSRGEFYRMWVTKPQALIDLLPKTNPDGNLSKSAFEILRVCWKIKPSERPRMVEARAKYRQEKPTSDDPLTTQGSGKPQLLQPDVQ